MSNTEILRSSVTPDGQRVFLEFDNSTREYLLSTRWARLAKLGDIHDACVAFEALEFMEGDLRPVAKAIKADIRRVPNSAFGSKGHIGMGRVNYLINCVERRLAGLRPVRCGSKGSVEKWVSA